MMDTDTTARVSFSIGSNNAAQESGMNMSLDEIIESRRKKEKKRTPLKTNPRSSVKKSVTAQTMIKNKLKRNNLVASNRGLRPPQQSNTTTSRGTNSTIRRSVRNQDNHGKTQADRKVKAKLAILTNRVNRPSAKAMKAAVNAMTSAGYKVPKGMKMVITFESDSAQSSSGKNKGNKLKTGTQTFTFNTSSTRGGLSRISK